MSNQLTTTARIGELVKLPKYSQRFQEVLKDRAPQFVSSLIQVGNSLGEDCEPTSIIASAMTAAALNLPIDKNLGFAWLVPYKGKHGKVAQFQMGYKGYIQLALRTGQYSRLNVCEVFEGELERYDKLTGDLVINTAAKKSDKVAGYASYLRLTSGFEHSEYWSIEEVEAHAKRYSQAFRSGYETPWKSHFDEMAMKTVLSMHIRKWGPMTTAEAKAYNADNAVLRDIDADPEFPDATEVVVEKPKKPEISKKKQDPKTVDVKAEPMTETAPEQADPPSEPATESVKVPAVVLEFRKVFTDADLDINLFKRQISETFGEEVQAEVETWSTVDDVSERFAEYIMSEKKRIANMKVRCEKEV